jgi:hypothetical protein
MTSARKNTGYPACYGPDTLFAVPPAASVSPARHTCQPGSWWASRRVGLSLTLPTQAPHNANRRASEAGPVVHGCSLRSVVNHDDGDGNARPQKVPAHVANG